MALIEEAIRSLVLSAASGRAYPYKLPQGVTLPACTYYKVSAPRDHTQQGPSGLVSARIQVSSWGTTYDAAKTLSDAVRQALDGYMGTTDGVYIGGVQLVNETDLSEPEPEIFQTAMDFRVMHGEQIA
ncbi:MAG TPA: DUF3168 domain-containing protein [Dehalococcoidia bacterium]